jgi:hypothetical protein
VADVARVPSSVQSVLAVNNTPSIGTHQAWLHGPHHQTSWPDERLSRAGKPQRRLQRHILVRRYHIGWNSPFHQAEPLPGCCAGSRMRVCLVDKDEQRNVAQVNQVDSRKRTNLHPAAVRLTRRHPTRSCRASWVITFRHQPPGNGKMVLSQFCTLTVQRNTDDIAVRPDLRY